MSEKIRAFIAFELPENVRAAIGKVQERFGAYRFNVRWVKTANIHLTLKFLGNIGRDEITPIEAAILKAVADFKPLPLAAKGVGVFPGIKRPRVIWVGVSGQVQLLMQLQKSIDEQLTTIGFARENRSFKAHLTIGRVKSRIVPGQLAAAIGETTGFEPEPFTADRVILYQSDLQPAGPIYTRLKCIKL
jgi:2'-5' RNA ligase